MFLFTTPPAASEAQQAPQAKSDHPVARHVQQASQATGISFDYLMRTAKRESGLNPAAKASTSSATGLFQFIEQTWLGLIKKEGANHGLADAADAIQKDRSGRFVVPDQAARKQILDLRKDPALSSTLAGIFTQKNRETLRDQIGRDPNSAELYMAHFLGAQGASGLISLAESEPTASAAKAFPDAAAANRSIFFDSKGRSRTVREVYARLSTFHSGAEPAAVQVAGADRQPSADAPSQTVPGGAGSIPRLVTPTGQARSNAALHGLFRAGADGIQAREIRKTWLNVAAERLRPGSPSFFPREGGVAKVAAVSADVVLADKSEAKVNPAAPAVDPEKASVGGISSAFSNRAAPMDLTKFGRGR
ncbi:MltD_like domain containing protein [Rhabdaerophilaceae bacterium]